VHELLLGQTQLDSIPRDSASTVIINIGDLERGQRRICRGKQVALRVPPRVNGPQSRRIK
jgi:hypothetical protein